MPRRKRYDPKLVDVDFVRQHRATWRFGNRRLSGREYLYAVKDRNFDLLNRWLFGIQVPHMRNGRVVVQPRESPGKTAWAGIERRSIALSRATKHPHRAKLYCKINVADPTGQKTKLGTRRGERDLLPKWFSHFRWRMRLKNTVTTTRGFDAKAQVILVDPSDHRTMIRVFFALKVWVLQERFMLG